MDDGQQGTSVECPGCRERDARIAELERRLAELERKLEPLTRDTQRQTARFPRRKVIPPEQHQPPGRKPGHDGAFRAIPKKVHRTIRVPGATCPECRVKLVEPQTRELYQTDIPPIEPQVTKFVVRALPTYEWLIEALRKAGVLHADETGWRVSRRNAWLWVFASQDITIYAIRFSRGGEVPAEMLGEDFDGVLIVDGLASYDVLECVKGRCVAHILRRARGLTESDTLPKSDRDHVENLITLLKTALDTAARRDEWAKSTYSRKCSRLEQDFDDWLTRCDGRHTDVQRLAKHLRKHRDEWLLFLYDPDVPATNNHGERQIRPGVLLRKQGSCNRKILHAMAHEITASLTTTCRQRGHPFLTLAKTLWLARTPRAIPIPA